MGKALTDILTNTKDIFMTDSAMTTLLDFERVLDELDLYVFAHWKEGELVEGPVYEKYFVTCTFMWPYKRMPDPRGGERLLSYDCEVYYEESKLEYPAKVKNPDDFEAGTKMPKMKKAPIWLVTIVMPKKLMQEINQGSLELEGESIDMEDVEQAYEEGTDDTSEESNGADPMAQTTPAEGQENAQPTA